jgi:hypothetical protein
MKKQLFLVITAIALCGCSEKVEKGPQANSSLNFDVCKMSGKELMAWGKEHCPSTNDETHRMCAKVANAADECHPEASAHTTRF